MYFYLFFALLAGGFGFLISVLLLLVLGFPLIIVFRRSLLVFILLFSTGFLLTFFLQKKGEVREERKREEEIKEKISGEATGDRKEGQSTEEEFSPMNPTVLEISEEEEL
ncbi:MAG: hypothetical protein ACOCZM_01470 [Bacillota bacterium]